MIQDALFILTYLKLIYLSKRISNRISFPIFSLYTRQSIYLLFQELLILEGSSPFYKMLLHQHYFRLENAIHSCFNTTPSASLFRFPVT